MRKTAIGIILLLSACKQSNVSSDSIQREQQERLLKEATAEVGMPAIKNFRERKILKDILELRDQDGLVTYTYTWSDVNGKATFLCNSIGYAIPYATQFTNPQKVEYYNNPNQSGYSYQVLPQADPNGLFSPTSAEGSWVLCKDPNSNKVVPVYSEPKLIVSPFPLQGSSDEK